MQSHRPIDRDQADEVWAIYQFNATVKACCGLIKSAMLDGGLDFPGADDGEFDRYTSLASSAIDWLLCVGVIPVTLEQDRYTGKWVPVIPDYTAVCLYVEVTQIGVKKYYASFRNQVVGHKADVPELWVWTYDNMGPAADGSLTTNIIALLPNWELERFLTNRAMIAEQIVSNPPLITQDSNKRIQEMDGLDSNIGNKEIELSEIDRITTIENVRHGQYEAYITNWSGGVPRGEHQYQQFMQQCEVSHIYAPAERAVAQGPHAHSCLPQLLHLKEYVAEQVYQLFGVHNPHKSRGDNKNAVRTGAVTQEAMNRNIKRYSTIVERFLNHCYGVCLHKTGHSKKKKDLPRESIKPKNVHTMLTLTSGSEKEPDNPEEPGNPEEEEEEDDYFEQHKTGKSIIKLMRIPGIDSQEAMQFVETGFVTHAEATAFIRGKLGLQDLSVQKGAFIPERPTKKAKKDE